ncbi:hypothetical protein EJ07DRAFT_144197 [Lizonia empirigonia]|nr:hypothetical protein EJ07DRAFT_144197 [Lizonia empirigonia]
METPSIFLCTDKKNSFTYQDGYQDVTDSELEDLLEIGRRLVFSLEAEVEARRLVAKVELSTAVYDCIAKLNKSVANLKTLERLNEKETKLIASATCILKAAQTSREGKLYQTFLRDIHRQCGRGLVLLCAASLGKQRTTSLNAKDRTQFVSHLKAIKGVFDFPILDALVKQHRVPNENGMLPSLTFRLDATTDIFQNYSCPIGTVFGVYSTRRGGSPMIRAS